MHGQKQVNVLLLVPVGEAKLVQSIWKENALHYLCTCERWHYLTHKCLINDMVMTTDYHHSIIISKTSNWSFYCKTCGWYWYMNLNSDLAMQTFFSIHFQTTSGFTIGLLWREGDQGYWGLNASSLDGIWWLKRHTDRSPNSLQWQLGLPDELRLYQEGLEMDVILKNTKLRRCESPQPPFLSCFYSGGVESSRILNFLKVKTVVILTKLTGNRLHLSLYKVSLNYFCLKQMWSFFSLIETNRK